MLDSTLCSNPLDVPYLGGDMQVKALDVLHANPLSMDIFDDFGLDNYMDGTDPISLLLLDDDMCADRKAPLPCSQQFNPELPAFDLFDGFSVPVKEESPSEDSHHTCSMSSSRSSNSEDSYGVVPQNTRRPNTKRRRRTTSSRRRPKMAELSPTKQEQLREKSREAARRRRLRLRKQACALDDEVLTLNMKHEALVAQHADLSKELSVLRNLVLEKYSKSS